MGAWCFDVGVPPGPVCVLGTVPCSCGASVFGSGHAPLGSAGKCRPRVVLVNAAALLVGPIMGPLLSVVVAIVAATPIVPIAVTHECGMAETVPVVPASGVTSVTSRMVRVWCVITDGTMCTRQEPIQV